MTTTTTDLVDGVVAEVERLGDMTMGGIRRYAAAHGMNVDGDHWLELHNARNVFIVIGASEEFCDLVSALRASGRLKQSVAHPLVLMCDGDTFYGLPLAKRPPAAGYKDPHWVPLLFTPRS